jgi:hypothetical protein
VLWESGAAAGVALASKKRDPVVPITFSIPPEEIPKPLVDIQAVSGDTDQDGGIVKLLQDLNQKVPHPLEDDAFNSKKVEYLPGFLEGIQKHLEDSKPLESLFGSILQSFPAALLRGFWATSYQFASENLTSCHSEIVQLVDESPRRLRAETCPSPTPRTEGRNRPYCNKIDFELVNRHLVGHWKNISDRFYFGSVHLAVLPGENIFKGYYTAFGRNLGVDWGPWKWVRIDQKTIQEAALPHLALREPKEIWDLLAARKEDDGPLSLIDIVGGL